MDLGNPRSVDLQQRQVVVGVLVGHHRRAGDSAEACVELELKAFGGVLLAVGSVPSRGVPGGWRARTQEATRSSAARADEDEARRRQGRLEWDGIYGGEHLIKALQAASMSPDRISASPIRTASTPASSSSARSRAVRRP